MLHTRLLEKSNKLQAVHSAHVQHIESNVIRMTHEVRNSVVQFRHRTLTIVMHRAMERVRQQQIRKAFFKWLIQVMKQREAESVLEANSIQCQLKRELEKSEKMTYWAVSMTRVDCESKTNSLMLETSFNKLQLQVALRKLKNSKLSMTAYKGRILFHVGKTLCCILLRNRKQKLLRRFTFWRVYANKHKSVELESKTAELRKMLVGAKASAESSIVEIVRERLNRGLSSDGSSYYDDPSENVRRLSPRTEFK